MKSLINNNNAGDGFFLVLKREGLLLFSELREHGRISRFSVLFARRKFERYKDVEMDSKLVVKVAGKLDEKTSGSRAVSIVV